MTAKGIKHAIGAVLLLTLWGCGNEPVDSSSNTVIQDAGTALWAKLKGASNQNASLTRAQLADADFSLLWIEAPVTGAKGSAIVIGQNEDAVTWITANAVTLITKDDVVFATRGLGPDLLTSETTQARAAIRNRRGASYPRNFRFVGGDESIRIERYYCELENDGAVTRVILDISHSTTQLHETCYELEGNREFRNVYWVGADGTIWESRQWISPQAGYLNFQRYLK